MAEKALDTHYNGYRFRSRLAARWAVFFDTAGLAYRYESTAFDLGDGQHYRPDFCLKRGIRFLGEEKPRQDVWVEIVPAAELAEEDRRKVTSFVQQTGKNILLIAGDPGLQADVLYVQRLEDNTLEAADVVFMELADGQTGLVSELGRARLASSADQALIEQSMRTERLRQAYTAARKTRFDRHMKHCRRCGQEFQPTHKRDHLCYSCTSRESASNGRGKSGTPRQKRKSKSEIERLLAILSPEQRRIALSMLIVVMIGAVAWSACQVANLPGAVLGFIDGDEQPTATPGLPATYTPVPTPEVTMEGLVPGIAGTRSTCSCTADLYECADFASQGEAQACFDFCRKFVGDVHQLDDNGDGLVCVIEP
ncbi:MAG: hypothetical protein PVH18_05495 [Chloroflexota bacterium]|jgi:hypothetical protein